MSRREKRPTKKDRRAEGRAILRSLPKLSETMLRFAKPLIEQLPDPPPIEDLRECLVLVTIAWNLPVYEQKKHPSAPGMRATFDQGMAAMPPGIAKILAAMVYARLTTYASDPRIGFIEAVDEGGGRARIHATATLTDHESGAW